MGLGFLPSGPWKALLLTASLLTSWSPLGDGRLTIATEGQVRGVQRESQGGPGTLVPLYSVPSRRRKGLLTSAPLRVPGTRSNTTKELRPNGSPGPASVQLQVLQMVSKPRITANTTSITEAKGSVAFRCLTKDKGITILWFLNNQAIPQSKRLLLSNDNKTLTLLETRREDAGQYQCEVWNQLGAQSSDHITLTIYYGPDDVNITREPGAQLVHTISVNANSTLMLRCQAKSHPLAQYKWLLNDSALVRNGSYLRLQGGSLVPRKYTCMAWNNLTKRSAATSVYIEPLPDPDLIYSVSFHSFLILGVIVAGILAVVTLLSVLGYFRFKKARGYSREVLVRPGGKEKNLSSMKYSDTAIYENGLQHESQTPDEQMVASTQDVDPYYISSPNLSKNSYQMLKPPQDVAILSPDSLENPYQELTSASVDVYGQIGPKEAHLEKDEDLRD